MENDPTILDVVIHLNELLAALEIPIEIDSPLDLTPSLLIAILESILERRLPLAQSIRTAKSYGSKVEAMKIFLGTLSDDVIQQEVGIEEVDPRRLASGEWDEILFIARLLIWLGGERGLLTDVDASRPELEHSISAESSAMGSLGEFGIHIQDRAEVDPDSLRRTTSRLHGQSTPVANKSPSMSSRRMQQRDAPGMSALPDALMDSTAANDSYDFGEGVSTFPRETSLSRSYQSDQSEMENSAVSGSQDPLHSPLRRTSPFRDKRPSADTSRISSQKLPNPKDMFSPISPPKPPVRRSGWIRPVEGDVEAFEERNGSRPRALRRDQSASLAETSALRTFDSSLHFSPRTPAGANIRSHVTRHTSPTQHALALIGERARLLEELAKLHVSNPRGSVPDESDEGIDSD